MKNNMFCKSFSTPSELALAVQVARGELPADFAIRSASVLDVFRGVFITSDIIIFRDKIVALGEGYKAKKELDAQGLYAVPGFIDGHCHIESSLMIPKHFEAMVLPLGTTTVLWDPHEIANVWGIEGINWAIRQSEHLLLDVLIMVPSCVPATDPSLGFETSGAFLTPDDLASFIQHPRVLGLAEMMAYPSVVNGDQSTLEKLSNFYGMPRDGHAPGLTGKALNAYAAAGMMSCHESTELGEAEEKLSRGIHVHIREGSCAKDAHKLLPLLSPYSSSVVSFCSDDRNPKDIQESGHISAIINMGLMRGILPEVIFRSASFAPARTYGLGDRGAIAPGYIADICLVAPQKTFWTSGFSCQHVVKKGVVVTKDLAALNVMADGKDTKTLSGNNPQVPMTAAPRKKNIFLAPIQKDRLMLPPTPNTLTNVRVIGVRPGQILTDHLIVPLETPGGRISSDLNADIIKICVFERHHADLNTHTTALVKGFGLKNAAIASSINHDSHNVIAVGSSDELIVNAVNTLITLDGAIVVVHEDGSVESLSLNVAGLMSDAEPQVIAQKLRALKSLAQRGGCLLEEPFLQLSFLALPVIPSLKITDRGLIDSQNFCKVDLMAP